MTEEKQSQLEILCEVPLKLKIGDGDFTVHPLTFNRLVKLKPHAEAIFKKVGGVAEMDFGSGEFIGTIFSKIEELAEDLFGAMKVVLNPNGKPDGEITDEVLKEYLDTYTLGKILGFLVKTSNIGETVKNVSILRGMTK